MTIFSFSRLSFTEMSSKETLILHIQKCICDDPPVCGYTNGLLSVNPNLKKPVLHHLPGKVKEVVTGAADEDTTFVVTEPHIIHVAIREGAGKAIGVVLAEFWAKISCGKRDTDEGADDSLSYFSSQVASATERRKIIALKKAGSGASYFPGNFGFLESDLGPGANELKNSLARVNPGTCFRRDGVETQTGAVNSARHAVNTRFDIYDGNFNGKKNDPSFRPAENVTKGYKPKGGGGGGGSACNQEPDTATPPTRMGFPIDSVINTNRLGNGNWDFNGYWAINHPGVSAPNGWDNSDANRPSRFDVYQWELENGIPNNSASGGENGNPTCSSSTVSPDPDRRILYAAVLNCNELGLKGGSGGTVPALTFLKMFITQPMTKLPGTGHTDEDDTLYVEMVDIVKPGTADAVVHDIVQLYR